MFEDLPHELHTAAGLDVDLVLDVTDAIEEFFRGVIAVDTGEHGVDIDVVAIGGGLVDPLHDVFEYIAVAGFGDAEGFLCAEVAGDGGAELLVISTEFEVGNDLMAEDA